MEFVTGTTLAKSSSILTIRRKETAMAEIFRCEVMTDGKVCMGNLVKTVSQGEQVLKCDKCEQEIPLRDLENRLEEFLPGKPVLKFDLKITVCQKEEPDSTPANFGETWFRR
jgi:hypothetical protein